MNEEEEALECCKCHKKLVLRKTQFHYMGFSFHTDLPCCPCCGQVYISEELARGKIAEVEMELEEK